MKIGLFGGSFDPVHKEHVALAHSAVENLKLDKLIVLPAGIPPHKQGKRLAGGEDRLQMCRIAFSALPEVEVSDYEIKKAGTSYTYLTCRHFKSLYPDAELFFLVGTDMFWDFFSWREPKDILKNTTLAVCRRNEGEQNISEQKEAFFSAFQASFAVIPYNGKNVSSTAIRTSVALGDSAKPWLPDGVEEYILENKLYQDERIPRGLALEKDTRRAHSKRVTYFAMENANRFHLDENKVLLASALHDVAKNLSSDSPYLEGFVPPPDVPDPVLHQYSGAYVLEKFFSVADEEVLNAVRYHTSGRAGMSTLEKLVFLADMLEDGRSFPGVGELREIFKRDLDECLFTALKHQVEYLTATGAPVYPLTLQAYDYYLKQRKEK